MEIILISQAFLTAFALFFYWAMKKHHRVNLWRKAQCYAAARADGIEVESQRYQDYKQHMGVN
jgi:hypothetical protein